MKPPLLNKSTDQRIVTNLARYQALGVPKVWFWKDGVLTLHHLGTGGYEQIQQSELDLISLILTC